MLKPEFNFDQQQWQRKFGVILLWPQKISIPTHSKESWEILWERRVLKTKILKVWIINNKTEIFSREVGDGSLNQ